MEAAHVFRERRASTPEMPAAKTWQEFVHNIGGRIYDGLFYYPERKQVVVTGPDGTPLVRVCCVSAAIWSVSTVSPWKTRRQIRELCGAMLLAEQVSAVVEHFKPFE